MAFYRPSLCVSLFVQPSLVFYVVSILDITVSSLHRVPPVFAPASDEFFLFETHRTISLILAALIG